MPHAVILDADQPPEFGREPLSREGSTIHKIVEMAQTPDAWILKSLILETGKQTKFLTRIEHREDGLVVRIDDHIHVDRTPVVFDHLARITEAVVEANPGSRVGTTNLQKQLEKKSDADTRPAQ